MAKILRRDIAAGIFRRDYGSLIGRKSFSSSSSTSDGGLVEVNPGEVGIISGIPQEHLRRRVLIYSPARTASQQGSGKVGKWKINFLSTQKWENPLMGWTSTGDPYANVGDAGLSFNSAEAAKAFAEKYGWEYEVFCYHCHPTMFVDDQALQCSLSFLKPGGGYFVPFTYKRVDLGMILSLTRLRG